MIFIFIGLVVGCVLGNATLGHQGGSIGLVMGALAGWLVQHSTKIGTLEKSIKQLTKQLAEQKLEASAHEIRELAQPQTQIILDDFLLPVQVQRTKPAQRTQPVTKQHNMAVVSKTVVNKTIVNKTVASEAVATVSVPRTKPVVPRKPTVIDQITDVVHRFFTEGNFIVRIGMVVMFFGVSFLVKYASGRGVFPIELRLTGVILIAIALLVVGWRTRARAGAYGLVLQGGGIAVIYLTLFAAAKIYGLIPLGIAFGLLFLVVMLGVLLALLQNAQVLAILATAGGFLAPILTSTGDGSHVALFSFYLILNLGILAIALHKAWRLLNWVGFIFTFVITVAWGVLKYEPSLYASTQPFLIAFFALYLTVAVLFSFKQPANLKGIVDGSLVFGLPLVAFGLQTTLLQHTEYGLAISALVLAVIYLGLSAGLARRHMQSHRVLVESFLALGVSFATLAVPLALDASWTAVTWALEASGLVWVGLRQDRLRRRLAGYLLHVGAAASLIYVSGIHTGARPVLDGDFIALMLLSLTAFIIAYVLYRFHNVPRDFEKSLSALAIIVGVFWWFLAGINEMKAHLDYQHHFAAFLLFATCSAITLLVVSKKLAWNDQAWDNLANSVYALLPFVWLLSLKIFGINDVEHPSHGFALLSIALFFIAQYYFLFTKEKLALQSGKTDHQNLVSIWHVLTAWLVFALIFWEISWQKTNLTLEGTAGLMLWFGAIVIPMVALLASVRQKVWPFISHQYEYKNWVPAPLIALCAFWFFAVCHKTTLATELYLPLLNPLDLAQFAIILLFAYVIKHEFFDQAAFIPRTARMGLLGFMLFVWVNVVTVRAMSHYQNIPYDFDLLWDAVQVQMALSILWAVCALIVMNLSRRVKSRELWMVGAGLLGLVLFKLFTKDLSGSGTLARIISFMAVGGLMLLIGFLSPLPAKIKAGTAADE